MHTHTHTHTLTHNHCNILCVWKLVILLSIHAPGTPQYPLSSSVPTLLLSTHSPLQYPLSSSVPTLLLSTHSPPQYPLSSLGPEYSTGLSLLGSCNMHPCKLQGACIFNTTPVYYSSVFHIRTFSYTHPPPPTHTGNCRCLW